MPQSALSLRQVQRAWRTALGQTGDDLNESFEAAGGDSLSLLMFVQNLEHRVGLALPLESFNVLQSQAEMAQALAEHLARAAASGIRPEAASIFLLPGIGGDEPRLAGFRRECATLGPMITLSYPDWATILRRVRKVEVLITLMADRIEQRAPRGPIALVGYSFGGNVGYAVALLLIERGRTVRYLAMLDTTPFWQVDGPRPVDPAAASMQAYAWADAAKRRLISPRWAPLLWLLAFLPQDCFVGRFGFFLRHLLMIEMLARMSRDWVRQTRIWPKLPLPLLVLRAEGHAPSVPDDLGWGACADDVCAVSVRGTHFTMFDGDNLRALSSSFLDMVDGLG